MMGEASDGPRGKANGGKMGQVKRCPKPERNQDEDVQREGVGTAMFL